MKIKFYAILTILFSATCINAQVIDKVQFEKARLEVISNLNQLEEEVIAHLRRSTDKDNAYFHIDEIKRILNELSAAAEQQVMIFPIDNDKLVSLLEAVDNENMDSDKKKIILLSANENYFLVSQLIQFLQKFTFDQDRMDIVEKVYPRLLDTENSHLLFKYFTFQSSKDKLEGIIKNNQNKQK